MMSLDTLGSYSIIEPLARGGMAEVFLALTAGGGDLRKKVAIKRILRQYHQSSKFLQMFRDEAALALQLRHKNIVTVFDYGTDRGHPFIVMEYVPGASLKTLKTRLADEGHPIPFVHWLYLLREIASGLSYAHQIKDQETGLPMNLIHRDITPQNLLLGTHGEVKIIDFGVARTDLSTTQTQFGTIKGKYGFLSPEQLETTKLDARSDLFSLGVLMWELLMNSKLFSFKAEVEYFAQLRSFRWSDQLLEGREIPPPISAIIRQLLQPKRDERYSSSEALFKDASVALNILDPGYTEMEFANFISRWIPEKVTEGPSQINPINKSMALSSVVMTKKFILHLPQGSLK
jgi:serine/threonine protein kinase